MANKIISDLTKTISPTKVNLQGVEEPTLSYNPTAQAQRKLIETDALTQTTNNLMAEIQDVETMNNRWETENKLKEKQILFQRQLAENPEIANSIDPENVDKVEGWILKLKDDMDFIISDSRLDKLDKTKMYESSLLQAESIKNGITTQRELTNYRNQTMAMEQQLQFNNQAIAATGSLNLDTDENTELEYQLDTFNNNLNSAIYGGMMNIANADEKRLVAIDGMLKEHTIKQFQALETSIAQGQGYKDDLLLDLEKVYEDMYFYDSETERVSFNKEFENKVDKVLKKSGLSDEKIGYAKTALLNQGYTAYHKKEGLKRLVEEDNRIVGSVHGEIANKNLEIRKNVSEKKREAQFGDGLTAFNSLNPDSQISFTHEVGFDRLISSYREYNQGYNYIEIPEAEKEKFYNDARTIITNSDHELSGDEMVTKLKENISSETGKTGTELDEYFYNVMKNLSMDGKFNINILTATGKEKEVISTMYGRDVMAEDNKFSKTELPLSFDLAKQDNQLNRIFLELGIDDAAEYGNLVNQIGYELQLKKDANYDKFATTGNAFGLHSFIKESDIVRKGINSKGKPFVTGAMNNQPVFDKAILDSDRANSMMEAQERYNAFINDQARMGELTRIIEEENLAPGALARGYFTADEIEKIETSMAGRWDDSAGLTKAKPLWDKIYSVGSNDVLTPKKTREIINNNDENFNSTDTSKVVKNEDGSKSIVIAGQEKINLKPRKKTEEIKAELDEFKQNKEIIENEFLAELDPTRLDDVLTAKFVNLAVNGTNEIGLQNIREDVKKSIESNETQLALQIAYTSLSDMIDEGVITDEQALEFVVGNVSDEVQKNYNKRYNKYMSDHLARQPETKDYGITQDTSKLYTIPRIKEYNSREGSTILDEDYTDTNGFTDFMSGMAAVVPTTGIGAKLVLTGADAVANTYKDIKKVKTAAGKAETLGRKLWSGVKKTPRSLAKGVGKLATLNLVYTGMAITAEAAAYGINPAIYTEIMMKGNVEKARRSNNPMTGALELLEAPDLLHDVPDLAIDLITWHAGDDYKNTSFSNVMDNRFTNFTRIWNSNPYSLSQEDRLRAACRDYGLNKEDTEKIIMDAEGANPKSYSGISRFAKKYAK